MRVHCISKAISHEINFEDNKALFRGKIGRKHCKLSKHKILDFNDCNSHLKWELRKFLTTTSTRTWLVNVPGKHVSTKDTANDVPQMRHIIHIGQGARDKDILFSFNGQTVKGSQSLYFGEGWKNVENGKWSLLNIAF